MTYEEAKRNFDIECEEIAQQCQEEGYPSRGSNYELRVEEARKYWASLVEE